jgi:hypothetical protein
MSPVNAKPAHERTVFLEFARTALLRIEETSVESRPQGEPDIKCLLGGEVTYFELGRLLDEGMQRLRLDAMRVAPQPVSFYDYDVKVPEREMLRKKLGKQYKTEGRPIELLLYFDNENWLVGDGPVFGDDFYPSHAEHLLLPFLAAAPHRFRRVWIYERHRPSVLWRYPT